MPSSCPACPFAFTEESEQVQNYGCLPTPRDITAMKERTGHNWSCHDNPKKMCSGFVNWCKENRPDLDVNSGGLIDADVWQRDGEEAALLHAERNLAAPRALDWQAYQGPAFVPLNALLMVELAYPNNTFGYKTATFEEDAADYIPRSLSHLCAKGAVMTRWAVIEQLLPST